jgi:ribulose-phosphate 3-epimerase
MSWQEWAREVEVEPSLYAADFARLGEQIETLLEAGVRVFHFDVGDGHFVEPITVGPIVLKSISSIVRARGGALDCHLMIETPEKHLEAVAEAGGDSVTVHYEACHDLPGVIAQARELGLGVGVAFNPESEPEDAVAATAGAEVDLFLCMSIHPGYSGQPFMPEALPRLRRLRQLVGAGVHVQVDGGVGLENIRASRESGATLFVAGTSIFGGPDLAEAYRQLVQALE